MAKNMDTSMKERIFRGTGWAWDMGWTAKWEDQDGKSFS